jgi:hypothetical protein
MTTYWIELGCEVITRSGHLEEHVLEVMDALMDEPRAIDPDITAELANNTVTITVGVEAATDTAALELALVIARSAVHKAGGFTPDWKETPGADFVVRDGFDARVRPASRLTAC